MESRLSVFMAVSGLMISSFAANARGADAGDPYLNILGTPAPEWEVQDWINSKPLTLKELRGKVVLIRWWTGPDCPFCSASAPILSDIHRSFSDRGVVVIGFFHDKMGKLRPAEVARLGRKLGMDFPLAVDPEWKTLKRYWLDRVSHPKWTSVSFLIDRDGIIRYIHPGGTITKRDGEELKKQIEDLLTVKGKSN